MTDNYLANLRGTRLSVFGLLPDVGAGAPASGGPYALGELWLDSAGEYWICTVAGSPGTWEEFRTTGSGTPSGTVVSEETFGLADSPGVAAAYSRGDHTHGSPVNPVTAHEAAGDPHPGYALEASTVMDGDGAGGVLSGSYPNPGFAVDMATQAELDGHIADAVDAHVASAITNTPAGTIAATTVQTALNELDTEKVPTSLTISTTAPLAGGGDLSANRTLTVGAASESAVGVAELGTQAEVDAGTDDLRIVTPLKLFRYGKQDNGICEGRLTLTTMTPVTTADVTAATTVYFTPYTGNRIALYDGTRWTLFAFTELSLSLSGFTAGKNSDIFIYDNAGTLTLELVEWTDDTTRATALVVQDGVYVKSGAATRRYLGTIRTTDTTGQCEDSTIHRYVWNYYNRILRDMAVFEGTSHTYNSATTRAWNGVQTAADVEFVIGVREDAITGNMTAQLERTAANNGTPFVFLGINSNTAATGIGAGSSVLGTMRLSGDTIFAVPQTGYNYLCGLENANPGVTAATFVFMYLTASIWG